MTQRNVRIIIFLSTTLLFVAAAGLLVSRFVVLDRDGILGVTYQEDVTSAATDKLTQRFPIFTELFTPGRVLLVMEESVAHRAGIRPGDTVQAVDGIPIADVDRLRDLAEAKHAGDTVTMRWSSGSTMRESPLRLESPLRNRKLYLSPMISCFIALAYFLIGTLVLRVRKDDRAALIFHVLTALAAGFFLAAALFELHVQGQRGILPNSSSFEPLTIGILVAYGVLALLMSAALLHFALVFPRPSEWIGKFPRLPVLVYLIGPLEIITFLLTMVGGTRRQPWAAILVVSIGVLAAGLALRAARRFRLEGWPGFARRPIETYVTVSAMLLLLLQLTRLAPPVIYFVTAASRYVASLLVCSFLFPIVTLTLFVASYRRATGEEKRQFRWPLFGLISAVGGLILVTGAGFVLGFYSGFTLDPSLMRTQTLIQTGGKLFYLLIPVSFAFGILKYRLMEIDVVIRKTLVYSIVSALVLVVYLVLVGVIGTWLIRWSGVQDQVVVVVSTLCVALAFVPIRNRVQTFVDRGFFRHRSNLQTAMRGLGSRLSQTDDVGLMMRIGAEEIQKALRLDGVAVMSGEAGRVPQFSALEPAGGRMREITALPLDRGLFDARSPADPADLPLESSTRAALVAAGVRRVCAPHADRGVVAVILVGGRLSGEEWDPDDDDFLATVGERMALSIESARLRLEEEEFRQAQAIQRSLLPRELPQLSRVSISGFWQPARAVGGDYYDAIQLDEHRVAVCVGDVVGKGMPAAILMSSLQAGVRALADADTSPAEVLSRARRVVTPSLEGGKFITLFYGVIDETRNELRYTNAGHNPAIVLRAGGAIESLETGGPAMARLFGSLPYEVGSVPLHSGDRILLFTDGLTEAVDRHQEPFGEDRVIAVAVERLGATARELQEALVAAALRHTGGTLQDDLTLVVIAVS